MVGKFREISPVMGSRDGITLQLTVVEEVFRNCHPLEGAMFEIGALRREPRAAASPAGFILSGAGGSEIFHGRSRRMTAGARLDGPRRNVDRLVSNSSTPSSRSSQSLTADISPNAIIGKPNAATTNARMAAPPDDFAMFPNPLVARDAGQAAAGARSRIRLMILWIVKQFFLVVTPDRSSNGERGGHL